MLRNMPSIPQPDHDAIRRLLSRYAELKHAGQDVEKMYPNVAQHLRECLDCRALLADAEQDSAGPLAWLSASELPFLHTSSEKPDIRVTPGSSAEAFRIHIALSLPGRHAYGNMRAPRPGTGPAEHGEQLLLADVVRLDDQEIGVTLVATQSATCENTPPGEVTVTGELYGDALPPVIHAQLAVGSRIYYASTHNGMLQFENVILPGEGEPINLTLEALG
ncbi:MAG: hypothetical protein WBH90_08875 [Aggregatilineales bacterium]